MLIKENYLNFSAAEGQFGQFSFWWRFEFLRSRPSLPIYHDWIVFCSLKNIYFAFREEGTPPPPPLFLMNNLNFVNNFGRLRDKT